MRRKIWIIAAEMQNSNKLIWTKSESLTLNSIEKSNREFQNQGELCKKAEKKSIKKVSS